MRYVHLGFTLPLILARLASAGEAPVEALAGEAISAGEIRGLLAKLTDLQARQDAADAAARADAIKALTEAVAGPSQSVALYQASVRLVEFEKAGKKAAEFEEWRKRNEERLHESVFGQALRLQYRYLKLALEADTEEKRVKAAPMLVGMADEFIKALPALGGQAKVAAEDPFASPVAARYGVAKRKPEGRRCTSAPCTPCS